jgi:predicted Zn-dependent peptidase
MKVHFIRIEKFKTIGVSLKMISPFDPLTVNKRVLIPQILLSGSLNFPNKQAIQKQLDYLYGTDIFASTQKIGEQSIISFDLMMVNEKYLITKPLLLRQGFALFSDIIFNPKRYSGLLRKKSVNEEIRMLDEELEAQYNDKNEYSFELFKKKMFATEAFRFSSRGDLITLKAENQVELTTYYGNMIQHDLKEMYIIGDFDQEEVSALIKEYFTFKNPQMTCTWLDLESTTKSGVSWFTDYGDIAQSRITIGFRTDIRSTSILYYPLVLFNLLFGETDQSALFQTVREMHHLSYYVSSAYQPNKGVLFVFAGVEEHNEEKATELIIECLHQLQNGDISDEAIFLAKEYLISRLKKNNDSMASIVGRTFMSLKLFDKPYDIEEIITQVTNVTKDQIQIASNSLVLDTIHFFKKEAIHE